MGNEPSTTFMEVLPVLLQWSAPPISLPGQDRCEHQESAAARAMARLVYKCLWCTSQRVLHLVRQHCRWLVNSGNSIGPQGVSGVLRVLRQLHTLQRLCLANNGIEDTGVGELVPALQNQTALVSLNLCANKIGQLGIRSLSPVLLQLTSLRSLELGHNSINPDGIVLLAPSLSVLQLHRLDLSYNPIGQPGILHLLPALSELSKLRILSLSSTGLKDADIPGLIEALPAGLQSLALSGNLLTELPAVLGEEFRALLHLCVLDNPITEPPMCVCSQGLDAIRAYYTDSTPEFSRPSCVPPLEGLEGIQERANRTSMISELGGMIASASQDLSRAVDGARDSLSESLSEGMASLASSPILNPFGEPSQP